MRVHTQHVLVFLESLRHRGAGDVGRGIPGERALCGGVDVVARFLAGALGAQPGRVHRVDADVGAVGRVDDGSELGHHGRRNGQALGEEDHRLAAGQRAHGVDQGEQAVAGRVSLLIALEHVEGLHRAALHLGHLRRRRGPPGRLSRLRGTWAAGCDSGQHVVHGVGGAERAGIRVGPPACVELRRAAIADLLDRFLEKRRIAGVSLVDRERQVDAEDADRGVALRLGYVAKRRFVRERARLRRQTVEHQRDHRRRRRRGRQLWRGSHRRRSGRLARVDGGRGFWRRKQRHRPDLLANAVFFDLEVGGGQVGDRIAAPVAHHDVHEDRRGVGLDGARGALRRRSLLPRDQWRGQKTCKDDRDQNLTHESLSNL